MTGWKPGLGAWIDENGTRFRVWSPTARSIDCVVIPSSETPSSLLPLEPSGDGYFTGVFPDIRAGTRYQFRIDGDRSYPDRRGP